MEQRLLKFRVWDKKEKEMIYDGIEYQLRVLQYPIIEREKTIIGFDDHPDYFAVMQYTNHNIHDKELYDGDIIRNEKMDDFEDAVEYLVCTFIKEWAMFGLLTIEEYHNYLKDGADCLDEYLFWTFPIDDKESEQRRICGDIYSTPELLNSL